MNATNMSQAKALLTNAGRMNGGRSGMASV